MHKAAAPKTSGAIVENHCITYHASQPPAGQHQAVYTLASGCACCSVVGKESFSRVDLKPRWERDSLACSSGKKERRDEQEQNET